MLEGWKHYCLAVHSWEDALVLSAAQVAWQIPLVSTGCLMKREPLLLFIASLPLKKSAWFQTSQHPKVVDTKVQDVHTLEKEQTKILSKSTARFIDKGGVVAEV